MFYQPNYGDGGDIPEERIVTIANSSETEYADIEETIKVHKRKFLRKRRKDDHKQFVFLKKYFSKDNINTPHKGIWVSEYIPVLIYDFMHTSINLCKKKNRRIL